ncbi:MAG TPA: hypothetical protein VGS08_02765 [Candidatus Saccharimonadales bacterium]|nr:hypothetical protein [Candidatus Saccharimonadales bacterium]
MVNSNVATKQDATAATPATADGGTARKVVVDAGGIKSIGLGVFAHSAQVPTFALSFDPEMGDKLTAKQERLEIPGVRKFMLLYQFRNFGDKPCQVAIMQQP